MDVPERIADIIGEQKSLVYLSYEVVQDTDVWVCWLVPILGQPFRYLTARKEGDPLSGEWINYTLEGSFGHDD